MRRLLWPSVALALVIAYPLLFSTPFQQRLGALVLLYAIAASAWNIVGGYAGQVSVGHVVFFGCGAYASMAAYSHFALPPLVGIPAGVIVSVLIAAIIGVPTLRLSGHYFSMATIAVAELVRLIVTNTDLSRRCRGPQRSDRAANRARPLLYLGAAVLLSVSVGSPDHARHHLVDGEQPDGILSPRHQGFRTRGAFTRRARQPHQALRLHAERGADQRRRRALCHDVRVRRSGIGTWYSDFREDADHGGARGAGLLFGPLVGAAILVPLEEISNNLLGGKGAGLTFVVYGAIIVLIARFQPGGILTLINRLWARQRKAPETTVTVEATHAP